MTLFRGSVNGGKEEKELGTSFCPNCKQPSPRGEEVCGACGLATVASCPKCGESQSAAERHCITCGTPMKPVTAYKKPATAEPAPSEPAADQDSVVPEAGDVVPEAGDAAPNPVAAPELAPAPPPEAPASSPPAALPPPPPVPVAAPSPAAAKVSQDRKVLDAEHRRITQDRLDALDAKDKIERQKKQLEDELARQKKEAETLRNNLGKESMTAKAREDAMKALKEKLDGFQVAYDQQATKLRKSDEEMAELNGELQELKKQSAYTPATEMAKEREAVEAQRTATVQRNLTLAEANKLQEEKVWTEMQRRLGILPASPAEQAITSGTISRQNREERREDSWERRESDREKREAEELRLRRELEERREKREADEARYRHEAEERREKREYEAEQRRLALEERRLRAEETKEKEGDSEVVKILREQNNTLLRRLEMQELADREKLAEERRRSELRAFMDEQQRLADELRAETVAVKGGAATDVDHFTGELAKAKQRYQTLKELFGEAGAKAVNAVEERKLAMAESGIQAVTGMVNGLIAQAGQQPGGQRRASRPPASRHAPSLQQAPPPGWKPDPTGTALGDEQFKAAAGQWFESEKMGSATHPTACTDGTIVLPPTYADSAAPQLRAAGVTFAEYKGYLIVHPRDHEKAAPVIDKLPEQ